MGNHGGSLFKLCCALFLFGLFSAGCKPLIANLRGAPFPATFSKAKDVSETKPTLEVRMESSDTEYATTVRYGYSPFAIHFVQAAQGKLAGRCFQITGLDVGSYVAFYDHHSYADLEGNFISCGNEKGE
jgi:hypothetical protein